MVPTATLHRAFLALWPDAEARESLAALPLPPGARPMAPEDLHLTLAFLGDLPLADPAGFLENFSSVAGGPVAVQLDRVEHWPGPEVLCATGDCPPVVELVSRLRAPLSRLGQAPEVRAFRPHVTLARRVVGPEATVSRLAQPLSWRAGSIVLAASGAASPGRRYHIVASGRL